MVPASSKKSSWVYIALLFLISALFTLIMASSNSPAAPNYYGADSSFSRQLGPECFGADFPMWITLT